MIIISNYNYTDDNNKITIKYSFMIFLSSSNKGKQWTSKQANT